jgi:HSP20 family protein
MSRMGNRPGHKNTASLHDLLFSHELSKLEAEPFAPGMDLAETRTEIVIRLDLAGVQENDVRVSISGRFLRVEGVKREPDFLNKEAVRFLLLERAYGSFRKQVELHWVIDPKSVTASMANGILTVILPKLIDRRGTVYEVPIRFESDE